MGKTAIGSARVEVTPEGNRLAIYSRLIDTARSQLQEGKIPRLKPSAFKDLEEGYSREELHRLVVPKRTLMRRKGPDAFLSAEETDKALRLARISAQADRVFGDPAKSDRWLRESNPVFGGKPPLDLLASEIGAGMVETLLHQIDHGIFV